MIILAIDPGFERLGIAVIEKTTGQKETLVYSECFKTSAKIPHHERLALIQTKFLDIIQIYQPECLAIETLLFSSNTSSAMPVAEVRGVLLANASLQGLRIYEYNPNTIKVAVTGYGKSDKGQVAHMVTRLIDTKDKKMIDDELDAIAIGLTFFAIEKTN